MLKLAEANRAIAAAHAYARDHGYFISVTVCDSMGHFIAHQRMDNALPLSSYGSVGKAIASAGLGIPSGEKSDVDIEQSPVSGVLAHGLPVIRRPGGLPIKRGGEIEGSIGVSGAPTDEQNEECARRGIEAIGS
jgi:glc operon protein GlcG